MPTMLRKPLSLVDKLPTLSPGFVAKTVLVLAKASLYRPPMPRLYELMRAVLSSNRDVSWEIVESKSIQPVPTFYDNEDVDILRLSPSETRATYVFEHELSMDSDSADTVCASMRSLIFARKRLIEEIAKNDYNVLLQEEWRVTILRKEMRQRIEVQYVGRGALAIVKAEMLRRKPPFIDMLGSP